MNIGRGARASVYAIAFACAAVCCGSVSDPDSTASDYRQLMRDFVMDIAQYAHSHQSGFIVIPQNGQELLTMDGEPDGNVASSYVSSIQGQGREDLYFGYSGDDMPTPASETDWMESFLDLAEENGVEVLVTDYCSTQAYVDSSYEWSQERGYVSFAADHRELDDIPVYPSQPWNCNTEDVQDLSDARNFLYLIDDSGFSSVDEFVNELSATDYDLLIVDLFCCGQQLSPDQVEALGTRPAEEAGW